MTKHSRTARGHYPLPNLFVLETREIAHALYAVAIPKLMWRGEPAEALHQLRLVRRFAEQARVAKKHTFWTYGFEVEAGIAAGVTEAAWRTCRQWLRDCYPRWYGRPLRERVNRMPFFLRYHEVPAAYFSGRLRHATEAMELFLDWSLKHEDAYELRHSIFNSAPSPTVPVRVSLFHLYQQAGRELDEWSQWRVWVKRLHPGLLEMCGITQKQLSADASLMSTFHERLMAHEKERRPVRVTFGQKDLLEPKAIVLARQSQAQTKIERPPDAHALMLRERRASYFPWLEGR